MKLNFCSGVFRVAFVTLAVLAIGSCKDSGGGSGGDGDCSGGECKLIASDIAFDNIFGFSVAIFDDVLVVGASQNDNENGNLAGAAYVYTLDGSVWSESQKLIAKGGSAEDRFGSSVAIDDGVMVVGSRTDSDAALNAGSAYVYRFVGGKWVQQAKLVASDAAAEDSFGRAVAVSGDVIVVGAFRDDDGGADSGSAYVFRFNGVDTWVEEMKLIASDAGFGDNFGVSVDVDGDVAVIGARGDDDVASDSGAAYVYRFNVMTMTWVQAQKLKALRKPLTCETQTLKANSFASDSFGISVAIDGDVIAVGADRIEFRRRQSTGCQLNNVLTDSGGVYVYRFNTPTVNGLFQFQAKLEASDGNQGALLGRSVAVDGATLVAGAKDDNATGQAKGAAYVYRFDGTDWLEDEKLTARDGKILDWLGASVGVDGDAVVVGAYGVGDNGPLSGAAYTFEL